MPQVVVIGAGIVGAGAAHRLSRAGAAVTLIDNGAVGGATAAGAGIIATISSRATDPETAGFRFKAARYHLELAANCEAVGLTGHSYAPIGQLTIAFDDGQADELDLELHRSLELVRTFGTASVGSPQWLSANDIRSRFPLVAPTAGGLWLPDVARLDGRALRDGLVRLARTAGATVVSGTAALQLRNGVVTGVRTESELHAADAVVLAAGAWSGQVSAAVGNLVQPQRGQIVHLHLPGVAALPTLDTIAGHYLLTFPGDRVVIGATRETGSGFGACISAGGLAQVLAQGLSLVPALTGATFLGARVGLRPLSFDGFPLLGAAPGVERLWLATGMGPSGLTVGPYCGAVIADAALAALTGDPAPFIPAAYDQARPAAVPAARIE